MKDSVFIIFAIVLAIILLVISLLINPMIGIFIASLTACLWLSRKQNTETGKKINDTHREET